MRALTLWRPWDEPVSKGVKLGLELGADGVFTATADVLPFGLLETTTPPAVSRARRPSETFSLEGCEGPQHA